jgi:hypothetical protein
MEEEHEYTVRDMSIQVDDAGRTSGTETQHGGRDHSVWLERPTSDRTQEYGQTTRGDLEDPVAPIRFLHAQQQLYNRMPEQMPMNALAYGQPGPSSTSSLPHTDYRQTVHQSQPYSQQPHHVPSGISLPIDDGGMFNNVDLILQAASERLTDPGSGGERNPVPDIPSDYATDFRDSTVSGNIAAPGIVGGQPSPSGFQFNLESPLDGLLTEEMLHDVFGWGVGAEDWQSQNPLMYDMLDFGNLEMNFALGMGRNGSMEGIGEGSTSGMERLGVPQVSWADQHMGGSSHGPNAYPGGSTSHGNGGSSPGPVRQEDETAWVSEPFMRAFCEIRVSYPLLFASRMSSNPQTALSCGVSHSANQSLPLKQGSSARMITLSSILKR